MVIVFRGQHLLVAAGQTAHVHDIGSGAFIRRYPTGDSEDALASLRVEGTRDGRLLIAGGSHTPSFFCFSTPTKMY